MKKQTVLITGAAGFIGSRFGDWIIENKSEDFNVIGIDDLSGGFIDNVNKEVTFYVGNLLNDDLMNRIFTENKIDYVYHFAALAAEGLSPFIRSFNYTNNLVATSKVVNQCIKHKIKRLVFTSTMAVYGHGKPPFDESHIPNPVDPYGIAKYACEMDIQVAGEQHGLDWCIIRPHNVYGLKQNIWDKYRNVLGIWMYQYMNQEDMTIFGDGMQKRAFSYIDDCLEPLWKAAIDKQASKEIINLGSSKFYTINEASSILKEVIGKEDTNFIYKEARHEVKDAHPTWTKSELLLNYKDNTSLKEGLTQMWEWAQKQPKRERFIWKQYELENGLYSFWKIK